MLVRPLPELSEVFALNLQQERELSSILPSTIETSVFFNRSNNHITLEVEADLVEVILVEDIINSIIRGLIAPFVIHRAILLIDVTRNMATLLAISFTSGQFY